MGKLTKVSVADFGLTAKRNHAAERREAQLSLFADLNELIGQREAGDIPAWQVALCLILCGLPYEETAERSVTRRARLADGSWLIVRFTATGERDEMDANGNPLLDPATGKAKITPIPLPFGADRGPLHFLINKAILRTKELQKQGLDSSAALFVPWETANEYLTEMRLAPGGKNRRDLRARIERIRWCAITVKRTLAEEPSLASLMFGRARLPRSLDRSQPASSQVVDLIPDGTAPQGRLGLEFSAEFYAEISRNHMPVPVQLLRATMGRSQIQDYVLWLYWRAFAARKDTLIPWRSVREQLWQNDSNETRLAAVMKRAITTLRAVWPELRAEVNPKHFGPEGKRVAGIVVGPPRDGIYIFHGVEAARKQIAVASPAKQPKKV
jgi:hypothetical protein